MAVFCQKGMRRGDDGRRSAHGLTQIASVQPRSAATIDECDLSIGTLRGLLVAER